MSSPTPKSVANIEDDALVAERYRLREAIGEGGVAVVYRADDVLTGREVALKRMKLRPGAPDSALAKDLFEREYHTLSQLSHPAVIEVYDYAADAAGAFYTMELLDGGDLHSMAPVSDHRLACGLVRDVCSALSLIHSRQLVHRDITPRNVRCTASNTAKLIDFGAMIQMGASAQVVATPPFCAPEVLDMRPLDGRTDLFALGATLYYVVCGRHAYPARALHQLREIWRTPPRLPSEIVSDVPRALDDLIMELLQLEPEARPVHAAEVWERLSAIGGLPLDEQPVVSQAYLTTPKLVGVERKLERIRRRITRAKEGLGASVMVEAASGMGRSRFVETCALQATVLGCDTLRASGIDAQAGDYGAVRALARRLLESHPELARAHAMRQKQVLGAILPELQDDEHPAEAGAVDRLTLQRALGQWFVDITAHHPLALIVDDADELDEPSAAWLAVLAHEARDKPLIIIASARQEALAKAEGALKLLADASVRTTLGGFSLAMTRELLQSIFSDAAYLDVLAERLHQVSAGNPRDMLQLARHLVDRGVINYHQGQWTLPAHIEVADLPESMARALADRVAELSASARELAQGFALAPGARWSLDECRELAAAGDHAPVLAALDELVRVGVLQTAGERYALSQRAFCEPLTNTLDEARKQQVHRRIAGLYAAAGDSFRMAQHLLRAGEGDHAVDVLVEHARTTKVETDADQQAWARLLDRIPDDYEATYDHALALCAERGRPAADRYALHARMSSLLGAKGGDLRGVIFDLVEQCRRDVGLDIYQTLEARAEPGADVLQAALDAAHKRYEELPPEARVFAPQDGLVPLVAAVVEALGVVTNSYDRTLWQSLPSLEPLIPLSPTFQIIDKIQYALGERLAGRYHAALSSYGEILERLEQPDRAGLPDAYHRGTLDGVTCARALVHAAMGSDAVLDAADKLEQREFFQVGAVKLRMLHSLWQGDGEAADQYARRCEVLQVQSHLVPQYSGGMLFTQLCALALSDDLVRLRRIMPAVERWAENASSWLPMLHYARGHQARIAGNTRRALEAFTEGIDLTEAGDHQLWPMLAGAIVQCHVDRQAYSEAAELGATYMQAIEAQGIDYPAIYVQMPLSFATAQVDGARGQAMAARVVDALTECGATGVPLGLAYHNLARICIATQDEESYQAALAGCEHWFGKSTNRALATKYRRLQREAQRAARAKGERPAARADEGATDAMVTMITTAFQACKENERARVAATLLAEHCQTNTLFLYLPTSQGPQLSATIGEHEPPPQLAELVSEFLEVESALGDDTTDTGIDLEHERDGVLYRSDCEDYHAFVLGHCDGSEYIITAVAVVGHDASEPFQYPGRIAVELSRLGFATGSEANRIVAR